MYTLQAPSEEELDNWLTALEEVLLWRKMYAFKTAWLVQHIQFVHIFVFRHNVKMIHD